LFVNPDGSTRKPPIAEKEIGAISGTVPDWAAGETDSISAAVIDAADKIKNTDILQKGGFDIGLASEYLTLWQPENSVFSQTFTGGEHTGNPYGWGEQGRLMVNDVNSVAFPLFGDNLTRWAQLNGLKQVGYPLSYPYTDGSDTYQVFSRMYFKTDKLGYIENINLYAGAVSESDKYTYSQETGFGAASSNFLAVYRNYNNTGKNLGVPKDTVKLDGSGVFRQEFAAPGGGTNYIVQKGAQGSAFLVEGVSAEVFASVGADAAGAPKSVVFVYGGREYQNFEKGYIDRTDKRFVGDKNVRQSDGVEGAAGAQDIHPDTGVLSGSPSWDAAAIKREFTAAVNRLNDSGNYVYKPVDKVVVRNGYAVQEFEGTSSSAKGRLLLIKETRESAVYAIRDQIYQGYLTLGGIDGSVYAPLGEQFCFGVKLHQNFAGGYITLGAENLAKFVSGQNVSPAGDFVDLMTRQPANPVPAAVGQFGPLERIPVSLRDKQVEVRAAFEAEYLRLLKTGFDPGQPDTEFVHQWAPAASYSWVNQTFKNGDSSANVYDGVAVLRIFMMDLEKGAFSVYGEMLTAWVGLDGYTKLGYPVENQFFYAGDLYQNFNGGYIKCVKGSSSYAVIVQNERFDALEGGEDGGGNGRGCGCGSYAGLYTGAGAALTLLAAGVFLAKRRFSVKKEDAE
jgi:hypothetical protein